MAALMRVLLEDRKAREEQYEKEQAQIHERMERQRYWDELEQAQMRKRMERQRERDELEKTQMREQMQMLHKLIEESRQPEKPRTRLTEGEAKLVNLTEQDDIESYLTTFERIMRAYEVKEERRAVIVAPQLTGKLAYTAMKAEDAGNYQVVKEAILRRYDISEQTYRHRFRDAVMKDETVSELYESLTDLFLKWTKGCKTVEQLGTFYFGAAGECTANSVGDGEKTQDFGGGS